MNAFKKQLWIQLLIALGVVAATVIVTQIVASDLKGNAAKILQQKTDLAFRIRATDQLASLKAASDKARPLFSVLNSILPPKDDLINFGPALTQLAKNHRIDLGFTFGAETAPKAGVPGFIPFSITGSSTYESFQAFLRDLENSRYFVKLNSVDMVRPTGSETYNIIADGQVFYQ